MNILEPWLLSPPHDDSFPRLPPLPAINCTNPIYSGKFIINMNKISITAY